MPVGVIPVGSEIIYTIIIIIIIKVSTQTEMAVKIEINTTPRAEVAAISLAKSTPQPEVSTFQKIDQWQSVKTQAHK